MHDRKNSGLVKIVGLDVDEILTKPAYIRITAAIGSGRPRGKHAVNLAREKHLVERALHYARELNTVGQIQFCFFLAPWLVGAGLDPLDSCQIDAILLEPFMFS